MRGGRIENRPGRVDARAVEHHPDGHDVLDFFRLRLERDQKLDRQHHGHDHARRQRERGHAHRAVGRHELLSRGRPRRENHLHQHADHANRKPHHAEDDLAVERQVEDIGKVERAKHGVADRAAGQHHQPADDRRRAGQQREERRPLHDPLDFLHAGLGFVSVHGTPPKNLLCTTK